MKVKNHVQLRKLVKKKKKQVRCTYSKENLLSAVQEAKNGIMPIAEIARKYNVPESTIRSKRDNKYADKKPGPATVLSTQEEHEIAHWIFLCYQRGFPITKSQLLESVEVICQKIKREIPFSNGRPGRGWFTGFLRRHPQISKSIFENTSLDKANISEESLQEWFDQISTNISSINLLTIEPNRIFSCEEIGLGNPNSSTVFASKGSKIVQKTIYNNQKKNVSILIAGNAAGELAPTFLIFTKGSLSKKSAQTMSSGLTVDFSEDGLMTSANFYKFIVNVFDPWLTKTKVKRPVLLCIDSNKFQLTLDLSKFCTKNEIELIALHPNVTEIFNPLCVSFIHIFEAERIKVNSSITEDSSRKEIAIEQIVSNLKQTFDTLNVKELLPNCFMESGLYPSIVNSTDYNEISNGNENATIDNEMVDNSEYVNNWERLQILESLISNDKLETFRLNESREWKGERRDESLFEIWYKLSNSCTEIVHEANNRKINEPQIDIEDVKPVDLEFVKIENDNESDDVFV